ncbi:MAG: class I SAM-dependent methyltransferase [Actinomycetota bacterium]
MDAKRLLREGKRALIAARSNVSWTGDEGDVANDLLEHVLGYHPDPDEEIPARTAKRFHALIARRAEGEPIPHLVGYTEFRGLRLDVKKGAFVPRASTEVMAGEAAKRLKRRPKPVAVDLATGIGPVALAIANEVRKAQVFGVDIGGPAVAAARANAKKLKLRNVTFSKGDLFEPLPKRLKGAVDVITIHPPYVPKHELKDLPAELIRYEPVESLTDNSSTGTRIVERVAKESPEWLRPGGWLIVEVDAESNQLIKRVLKKHGSFADIRSIVGRWNFSRVIFART